MTQLCTGMVRESPRSGLMPSRLSSADERAWPAGQGSERTVYRCDDCASRYQARRWIQNCSKPCGRIGTGGKVSTAASRSPSMS